MGLGSYWVRKDDQSGETKTIKPWEETVSNGDKFFPDPHKNTLSEDDAKSKPQVITDMKNLMNNLDLEKMIAEDILANNNLMMLDSGDIQMLKDCSDFIEGSVVNGKPEELGELAKKAFTQIREAHPHNQLTMLIFKIRVAEKDSLMMEDINDLSEYLSELQEDLPMKWSIEVEAPIPDEIRFCMLAGFKE